MKTRILVTASMVIALAAPARAQLRDGRENPLTAARDLYASARYDEALAVLNGLPSDAVASDRKSIEQYRSLCLLALGRGTEAESAIAAVVTADPLFMPGEADASPRVRLAFSEVRQRLLPQIASTRYAAAKAAYDRKEYSSAEGQFRNLLALLDDPQMGGRLGDLRTLASGFVDLASAAAAPPPEPKKADPPGAGGPRAVSVSAEGAARLDGGGGWRDAAGCTAAGRSSRALGDLCPGARARLARGGHRRAGARHQPRAPPADSSDVRSAAPGCCQRVAI